MDKPKIIDQYCIIDRWWTEERETRIFCTILVAETKFTLRFDYDHETKEYIFVEARPEGGEDKNHS